MTPKQLYAYQVRMKERMNEWQNEIECVKIRETKCKKRDLKKENERKHEKESEKQREAKKKKREKEIKQEIKKKR